VTKGSGVQKAVKPMGCWRVELEGREVHDPPELMLMMVDRGTSSAQPGDGLDPLFAQLHVSLA